MHVAAGSVHALGAAEDLVADEDVVAHRHRVVGVAVRLCAEAPAVAELADQGRLGGGAAGDPPPDVEDDQPVVPVAEVGEAVFDGDVVQVAALALEVPASHLPRRRGVGDVDDVERPGAVVDGVDQVALDPHVVHARGEILGVAGEDPGVGRRADVQQDDPVPAVRRALPGDDRDLARLVDLHVVHDPGVDHDRVGDGRVARIGDVPGEHHVAAGPGGVGAGIGVVAPVDALEHPQVRGRPSGHRAVPDDLHRAASRPGLRRQLHGGRAGAHGRRGQEEPRALGDEPAVVVHVGGLGHPAAGSGHGPLDGDVAHRLAGRVPGDGGELDRAPHDDRPLRRLDLDAADRVLDHPHLGRRAHPLGVGRHRRRPRAPGVQEAPGAHRGDRLVRAAPGDVDLGALALLGEGPDRDPRPGAGVDRSFRSRDLDPRHRQRAHRHRRPLDDVLGRAPGDGGRTADEGVESRVTGPDRLHLAGLLVPARGLAADGVADLDPLDRLAGRVHGRDLEGAPLAHLEPQRVGAHAQLRDPQRGALGLAELPRTLGAPGSGPRPVGVRAALGAAGAARAGAADRGDEEQGEEQGEEGATGREAHRRGSRSEDGGLGGRLIRIPRTARRSRPAGGSAAGRRRARAPTAPAPCPR